jgi:hypothetical protein
MWQKRFRGNPIFQEIYRCGFTPEQLHRISEEFGPLSEIGRKRLHLGIIHVFESNWFIQWGWAKTAPASAQADRFGLVEDRANELLTLLGAGVAGGRLCWRETPGSRNELARPFWQRDGAYSSPGK